MIKKNMFKILGLLTVVVSLSACTTSSRDPFYRAWYDVYGNYCGRGNPQPGCNFYANGTKISATQDPYYNGNNTYYYDLWNYTNSYGVNRNYLGYAWLSNDGILYDNYGNALNEQEETSVSADVIAQAAQHEKYIATEVGKALAQKYALAEDKGILISKTLQDWAVLARDRARSDDDTNDFTSKLYGISPTKAKNAMNEAISTQNQKPLEDLNVDVAAHWGTTPEVSKEILRSWYKEESSVYGIK